MTFQELGLIPPLLKAVEKAGYDLPSPIQQKAIRPVLEGRDLLGCAQTGTGKTAAFALPMLQRLAANRPVRRQVRALVLTPTRELALQIDESFAEYGRYLPLRHAVIFGGVGQAPQVAALQHGVDILVACPGRLNDLIGQGFVELSGVEIFVLDEADRMLDMGFVNDVKKVIRKLPQKRQTLLFSATMPTEIEQLAESILHHPVEVKVDPVSSTVDKIEQSLYFVQKGEKPALLARLLAQPQVKNALVFSRTKHGADKIARILNKAGIPAAAIHGNKSQNARVAALESFKAGKVKALVATDIAARGIDIIDLSHVFNYDLPEVPETYVHRIGRTARAGQSGYSVSFCSPEEQEYLAGIEKLNRKKIPVAGGRPVPVSEAKLAVAEAARAKAEAMQSRIAARREKLAEKQGKEAAARDAGRRKAEGMESPTGKQGKQIPVNDTGRRRAEIIEKAGSALEAAKERARQKRSAARQAGASEAAVPGQKESAGPRPFWLPGENSQGKEEPFVEQNRPASGEGLSASAKRRRRRRRAVSEPAQPTQTQKPAAGTRAAQPAQTGKAERGGQPAHAAQVVKAGQNAQGQKPSRAVKGAARNQAQQPAAPAQKGAARSQAQQPAAPAQKGAARGQAQQPAAPAQKGAARGQAQQLAAPAQKGAARGQAQQPAAPAANPPAGRRVPREEDPGLLLIARKPPQQKFTSFEEYMKSHGGETAPIPDPDEED